MKPTHPVELLIWQQIEREVAGCDVVETTNPKTKQTVLKYGWGFAELTARATKLIYYGFKLHLVDDADGLQFVLDMPYHSSILRKFLRIAPSIDWNLPFTLQVWKGDRYNYSKHQRSGDTMKWFFTRSESSIIYLEVKHYRCAWLAPLRFFSFIGAVCPTSPPRRRRGIPIDIHSS